MAATYYTLLTKIGQAKIANAIALGQNVAWTQMEVGDGNGNPTTPNENQTSLVRRQYIANINQLTVDPENPNYMVAELIIPTDVGGWSVNEVGLRDADGDLVAVSNFPATYKPQLAEGSGRDLVVRIIVQVSNASVVTLKIDPAIVLASQKWVSDQYVKKVTVAGGTTGQVLAKSSNANEAFVWVDPTAAVNVIVDARPERQTLADGQTVVSLAVITTQAIAVFIEGVRLIETLDYTVNSATQFTLARSYPAGSRIHMYQNDPTSMISDASEAERGFIRLATDAEAIAGANDTKAMTPQNVRVATPGRLLARKVITATGTYTPTAGTNRILARVQGGGAGGGGTEADSNASTIAAASGGGAGAYGVVEITAVPASVAVTVGTAGAGGVGAVNGGAGGASSFGSFLTCPGGSGGVHGRSAVNTTAGPTASGGAGGAAPAGALYGAAGAAGNAGLYINAGALSGAGGSSEFGAGGAMIGIGTASVASSAATGYGAGGGGAARSAAGGAGTGGAGTPGIIIVEEYA